MKARELAEILINNPDYEVKVSIVTVDDKATGFRAIDYNTYNVRGIADIGYSDKVIVLDTYNNHDNN